jgi:hypothetical protein
LVESESWADLKIFPEIDRPFIFEFHNIRRHFGHKNGTRRGLWQIGTEVSVRLRPTLVSQQAFEIIGY